MIYCMTHTRRKTRLDVLVFVVWIVCLPLLTRLGLGSAPSPCETFTSVGGSTSWCTGSSGTHLEKCVTHAKFAFKLLHRKMSLCVPSPSSDFFMVLRSSSSPSDWPRTPHPFPTLVPSRYDTACCGAVWSLCSRIVATK